jgi:predicted AAA+ superfamily ATPase
MTQDFLERIADALDRISPRPFKIPDLENHNTFLWHASPDYLEPISNIASIDINLLIGIDSAKATLLKNTVQFSEGNSANNALLWGARGMGKSSLVKAVHTSLVQKCSQLKIVELQRDDLSSVTRLLALLRDSQYRFLLFCDDLSFSYDDQNYKSLKAVLDGGITGRPENVIFYATSNRRHLMPRDMIDNERSRGVNPSEAVEEKISLSDRFGLWLGFHPCDQNQYLEMIVGYCEKYDLKIETDVLFSEAIEWQATRGARSGRVAWQFFIDLAGRNGLSI